MMSGSGRGEWEDRNGEVRKSWKMQVARANLGAGNAIGSSDSTQGTRVDGRRNVRTCA